MFDVIKDYLDSSKKDSEKKSKQSSSDSDVADSVDVPV